MDYGFKSQQKGICYVWFLASCGLFFGIGIGAFGSFFKFYIKNFKDIAATKAQKDSIESNMNFFFCFGGLVICAAGGFIYDAIGRFPSLIIMFILEFLAIGGMAFKFIHLHYICRFIWGIAGCFSTLLISVMMNEILPKEIIKIYGSYFASFLMGGIILGYSFGFEWTVNWWRVPLMWAVIPEAFKFAIFLIFFRIESPVWLHEKKNSEERVAAEYEKLYTPATALALAKKLTARDKAATEEEPTFWDLFKQDRRIQMFLAVLLNMLNQLTGINFLIFYSDKIFSAITYPPWLYAKLKFLTPENVPTFLALGIACTNFIASLSLSWLLRRFTQRTIMISGLFGQAVGYAISIAGIAFNIVPLGVLGPYVYIFSFGLSLGSLIYDYCAKLVPPFAVSLCGIAQWVFTCLIAKYSKAFGSLLGNLYIFFLFQLLTVVGGILFVGYSIDNLHKTNPDDLKRDYENKGFFSGY